MDIEDLMDSDMMGTSPKAALLKPTFETEDGQEFSQADIIADMVNILRADTYMFGQVVGVEVEAAQMSPEEAAEIFHEAIMGDPSRLIDVFNTMEDQRDEILFHALPEERYVDFVDYKQENVYSAASDETPEEREETNGELDEEEVEEVVEEIREAAEDETVDEGEMETEVVETEDLREETEVGDRIEEEAPDETDGEEADVEDSTGRGSGDETTEDGVEEDEELEDEDDE